MTVSIRIPWRFSSRHSQRRMDGQIVVDAQCGVMRCSRGHTSDVRFVLDAVVTSWREQTVCFEAAFATT